MSGPCVFLIKPVTHECILIGKFQSLISPVLFPLSPDRISFPDRVPLSVKCLLSPCFTCIPMYLVALRALENHVAYGRQFPPHINGKLLKVPFPNFCSSVYLGKLSPTFRCDEVLGSQSSRHLASCAGCFPSLM